MAEYLPPTEDLPKFNEFVFEDAYSIEGLDRRVVHKAGTETITGIKTFTSGAFFNGGLSTPQVNGVIGGALAVFADTILSLFGTNSIDIFSNGKTSITSSTGQIELSTGAVPSGLNNEGILIENTSTTAGGITIRTNGTTGDIVLSSVDDINLTTTGTAGALTLKSTNSNVGITCGAGDTITLTNGATDKQTITSSATTMTNTNIGAVGNFVASRIFVGTIASNTPLLSFQLAGVKNGTSTSGGLLLQPAYDNVGGQDIFNFQVPFPIRILKYVLMFDADSGANTNLTLSFYFKTGGNAGTRFFDYTETITTIVSSTRSNSQTGNINGTTGLDYTTANIISIDYASSPANEWTLILYAQQR